MTRGYKVAAVTLALEMLLALGLPSNATGMFAIVGVVIVGVLWLPAAWMIWMDARGEDATLPAYVIAYTCGIAGGWRFLTLGKWTVQALAVTQG